MTEPLSVTVNVPLGVDEVPLLTAMVIVTVSLSSAGFSEDVIVTPVCAAICWANVGERLL